MCSDLEHAVMAAWAAKNLPARLDVETTAKVLGFAEHDIQILMAARKVTPLMINDQRLTKTANCWGVDQLQPDRSFLETDRRGANQIIL